MMDTLIASRVFESFQESEAVGAKLKPQPKQIESPRILLAATLRWPLAARLAIVFNKLGGSVSAWIPVGHPLKKANAVRCSYISNPMALQSSLSATILLAKPDFIIPCDDAAAILLHRLHESNRHKPASRELCSLIERSLGTPSSCSLAPDRGYLMELARTEGVRVPLTSKLSSSSDLEYWGARNGFPAVLKVDNTWGGLGVSVVRNIEEARRAYRLARHPAMVSSLKHFIFRRDSSHLFRWIKEAAPAVTIQKHITGRSANLAVACWKGDVLAGISAVALQTQSPTGPASVIQIVENVEMSDTASRMITSLGLSGLCGLDFVIEASTGDAYLIEINPRGTPISHLDLGSGNALASALYARIRGTPLPDKAPAVSGEVIAMFPGEWRRNSSSHYLSTAFHDVPWTEKELVRECLRVPWEERGIAARIRARLKLTRSQESVAILSSKG